MSKTGLRIWGAFAVAVVFTVSAAAMTATEAIKKRQKEMEGVREGMMTLAAIVKKEQPFDADVIHVLEGGRLRVGFRASFQNPARARSRPGPNPRSGPTAGTSTRS